MNHTKLFIFSLLFTILTCASVSAQTSPDKMSEGRKLFAAKAYDAAEAVFAEIAGKEPGNGRAWFFLGLSRHSKGKFEEAIKAFKKTVEISNAPAAIYNVAAGYARLGKREEAIEWLRKAIEKGAANSASLRADEDFTGIRNDAGFAALLEMADRKSEPCRYSKEARKFDFWIGDWEVFIGSRKVGENLVELDIKGCTLVENWTGTGGQTGKSLNVYDSSAKKWKQFYVGSLGGLLEFAGAFSDGIMHMEGETTDQKGNRVLHILEFHDLPDKTVRQWWRQSIDGGKTWKTVWDSIYRKRASKAEK